MWKHCAHEGTCAGLTLLWNSIRTCTFQTLLSTCLITHFWMRLMQWRKNCSIFEKCLKQSRRLTTAVSPPRGQSANKTLPDKNTSRHDVGLGQKHHSSVVQWQNEDEEGINTGSELKRPPRYKHLEIYKGIFTRWMHYINPTDLWSSPPSHLN